MVKAFSTLIFRGVVGIASIATTALITVLVQRYLYEKTGTPPLLFTPPASSEADQAAPLPFPPAAIESPAAVKPDPVDSEMEVSPEPELSQPELSQPEFGQPELGQFDQLSAPESADRQPTDRQPTDHQPIDRKTQIMEQFWDKLNR